MKILIASSAKKYSAIWRFAFELNNFFKKQKGYKIKWLDLYDENNSTRAKKLFSKINEKYDAAIFTSPLLSSLINHDNIKFNLVIVHDIYPVSVGKGTSLPVKLLAKMTYKKTKDADTILFVSNFSKKEFLEKYNYNNQSFVLPGGIDQKIMKSGKGSKSKYKIPKDKFIITHVGNDEYRKNLPFILELLKKLKENKIDTYFIKVGKAKLPKENTTMVTEITDKELANIYQISDVVLSPSYHEGMGLPPLEAMACGTPTIVSDRAGLAEFGIKQSITKLDTNEWVKKIIKIKKDTKFRNSMIKDGMEKSKEFNWNRYCTVVKEIVEDALG